MLDTLMGTPPTPPPPIPRPTSHRRAGRSAQDGPRQAEEHRARRRADVPWLRSIRSALALENFDAIGQWRTRDREADVPIDASTVLPTGVAIDGVVELPRADWPHVRRVRADCDREYC